jgi:hypothetical protein
MAMQMWHTIARSYSEVFSLQEVRGEYVEGAEKFLAGAFCIPL